MPITTGFHQHCVGRVAAASVSFLLLCPLTACKLWTIRPLEEKPQTPIAAAQQFNAAAYVDSIWQSKVIPTMLEKAVDLTAVLSALDADPEEAKKRYSSGDAGGAAHFIVKGEGRVSRVNSGSQNRAISISLPGYKGKTEVALQLGPAFRGTSLRDAVGFIQFNQFVNQLQFAEVGAKLNDRVATEVIKDFDLTTAQGKQISFHGAFTLSDRSKILITPVRLDIGGRP
jgi:predicted lipoprotein